MGAMFRDQAGQPIKFFIQKDLEPLIQTELQKLILELGGRTEAKVPRVGFILINTGSIEAQRLRACWSDIKRPERYFVPYTYVEACRESHGFIPQIFIKDGKPLMMHIHKSIANPNARAALAAQIEHSGGDPHASAQDARVILADKQTEVFQTLIAAYQDDASKHVESLLWIDKSIERGLVTYTPLVYKDPGGRKQGGGRVEFTEEDDENICKYVAAKIPYKESGGRTGNQLWIYLCDQAEQPDYAWVTRHSWQSWRERYKKKAERLDVIIDNIVGKTKPPKGEKGQYRYVREESLKSEKTIKKIRAREEAEAAAPAPNEGPSFSSGVEQEFDVPPVEPSQKKGKEKEKTVEPERYDDDDGWIIREGDAPVPKWGSQPPKKVQDEGQSRSSPRKRPAVDSEESSGSSSRKRPRLEEPLQAVVDPAILDKTLRDIAAEFRFTLEEVCEYYEDKQDVERTRRRFRTCRDVISAMRD